MKNMKKFAALLLTAAMTVAMVGCGSSVAANTVNSKDDLPGKKIGVQLGTTGDADATAYEDEGSTVERYNKGSEAIQALKTGKIDCVIIDKQPAEAFVEKNDDLKILDDTFDAEEYAICIAKDNTDLTDEFNKAIEELKADGTIDTIISNYIGDEAGEHPYETPEGTEYPNGKLTMVSSAPFCGANTALAPVVPHNGLVTSQAISKVHSFSLLSNASVSIVSRSFSSVAPNPISIPSFL